MDAEIRSKTTPNHRTASGACAVGMPSYGGAARSWLLPQFESLPYLQGSTRVCGQHTWATEIATGDPDHSETCRVFLLASRICPELAISYCAQITQVAHGTPIEHFEAKLD